MSKTLKLYHIEWEIDVEARSPEEAARLALDIQMDRGGVATVFVVNGKHVIDPSSVHLNIARNLPLSKRSEGLRNCPIIRWTTLHTDLDQI